MPNDAKFGLVVGVGLVITVAVVFFRKDSLEAPLPYRAPATADAASIASATNNARGPVEGTPAARGTRHIIIDGDTLHSLAIKYYSDGDRSLDIYHANRDVLNSPDRLPVGAEIRIP